MPIEQKRKLEEEIKSIEEETKAGEKSPSGSLKDKMGSVEMEGAGILKTISTRHVYVLAEELAFREIESEFGVSVHRQVAVGRDHGYDGIFLQHGKPMVIEIKYTKRIEHVKAIWRKELGRFSGIAQSMKPEPSFLFVVVAEGLNGEQTNVNISELMKMAEDVNLPVGIRFYDFDELKEKYGFSEVDTQQRH